jgi:hypothetical protein
VHQVSRVYQRRKQQYIFATMVGVVVVAVLLFFVLFYLPIRAEHSGLESAILELRAGIAQRQVALERLEDAEVRLAAARAGRAEFLSSHLVSREMGFAELLPDLDAMARVSGIQRGLEQYDIGDEPQFGVYPVAILMPARGNYAAVRRFIEELETSDRFFLLDSIGMVRSEDGPAGQLDVQLSMSTFFSEYE